MKRRDDEIGRVEKALRHAWSGQEPPVPSSDWRAGVMADITTDGVSAARDEDRFELQERLIWRFAAAAAALAVMFTIYLLRSEITGLSDLAMMMLQDPAGFMISPPFV